MIHTCTQGEGGQEACNIHKFAKCKLQIAWPSRPTTTTTTTKSAGQAKECAHNSKFITNLRAVSHDAWVTPTHTHTPAHTPTGNMREQANHAHTDTVAGRLGCPCVFAQVSVARWGRE